MAHTSGDGLTCCHDDDLLNAAVDFNRRIDLILASNALADRCTTSYIDREPRTWERPSDHTPVVAEFDV